jgi:hypothetical protein
MLKALDTQVPNLPAYDPARDMKFPWERELASAIDELRGESDSCGRQRVTH